MKKLLVVFALTSSIFLNLCLADGPVEFEGTKPIDQDNPKLHSRIRDGGSFVKKPEVVLSTVGPVPGGSAPVIPNTNSGTSNIRNLDVIVAPPGVLRFQNPNSGSPRNPNARNNNTGNPDPSFKNPNLRNPNLMNLDDEETSDDGRQWVPSGLDKNNNAASHPPNSDMHNSEMPNSGRE